MPLEHDYICPSFLIGSNLHLTTRITMPCMHHHTPWVVGLQYKSHNILCYQGLTLDFLRLNAQPFSQIRRHTTFQARRYTPAQPWWDPLRKFLNSCLSLASQDLETMIWDNRYIWIAQRTDLIKVTLAIIKSTLDYH